MFLTWGCDNISLMTSTQQDTNGFWNKIWNVCTLSAADKQYVEKQRPFFVAVFTIGPWAINISHMDQVKHFQLILDFRIYYSILRPLVLQHQMSYTQCIRVVLYWTRVLYIWSSIQQVFSSPIYAGFNLTSNAYFVVMH